MDRKSSNPLLGCAIAIAVITCVLAGGVVNAQAQMPMPPPIVMGNVTINGEDAPIGTVITAKVDEEVRETFVTEAVGKYSFSVNGSSEEDTGKNISLYVNDVRAGQAVEWKSALSGGIYTIDLAVATEKADSGSDSDSGSSSASTPEITPTPTLAPAETEGPSPSPAVPEMPGIPGIPPMPDSFYGNVEINGGPAPNGTVVRAYIEDKECGNITVIKEGDYADGINTYLDVRGGDADIGKQVNFTVDGAKANESAPFNPWDGPMQLNLSAQKSEGGEGFFGPLSSSFFPLAAIAAAVVIIVVVAATYLLRRGGGKKGEGGSER